jgi:hypothetical protein
MKQQYLLDRAAPDQFPEVTRRLCGLHAQVMSAGELIAATRVDGLSADAIQTALWQDRGLVKMWLLRGTLHLINSDDFPLYVAALSTLKHYRRASWQKYHGVNNEELDAIIEAVQTILTDVGITREQLADKLAERTGNPRLAELLRSGWGSILKPVAFQGYLCFGASEGQNVTFVQPQHWLGEWAAVDSQVALQTIMRRYLTAYGPATSDDFGRWFGAEPSVAKKLLKAPGLKDEVEEVQVGDWKGWMLAADVPTVRAMKPQRTVRLLPYFDAYTIGATRDCEYILAAEHKIRVYRPQGWISPVVLVDGQMVGVWDTEKKRSKTGRSLTALTVELFTPQPSSDVLEGIESEAARLSTFWGNQVEVVYQSET